IYFYSSDRLMRWLGAGMLALSLGVLALVDIVLGRGTDGVMLLGWGPEQTVLGTLGLLMLAKPKRSLIALFTIPLLLLWATTLMAFGWRIVDMYWLLPIAAWALLGAFAKYWRSLVA